MQYAVNQTKISNMEIASNYLFSYNGELKHIRICDHQKRNTTLKIV